MITMQMTMTPRCNLLLSLVVVLLLLLPHLSLLLHPLLRLLLWPLSPRLPTP